MLALVLVLVLVLALANIHCTGAGGNFPRFKLKHCGDILEKTVIRLICTFRVKPVVFWEHTELKYVSFNFEQAFFAFTLITPFPVSI